MLCTECQDSGVKANGTRCGCNTLPPIAKHGRWYRHADKEGEIIGQPGLDKTQSIIDREYKYTDIFHGPFARTAQTALAYAAATSIIARVHQPIDEFGKDELFKQIATEECKKVAKETSSWLKAVHQIHPDRVEELQKMAGTAVEKMFSSTNNSWIAFGHDPIVPFAAEYFGMTDARSLDTLEYIDFVQDINLKIWVVGIGPSNSK